MSGPEPPGDLDDGLGGRSTRILGTIISWTIAAINAKGYPKIDPNIVVDRQTLRRVGKVVCVYSARPLVQGAAAILELLARMILLILFLALSCTPRHRTVIVERVRSSLEMHVNTVRRCVPARIAAPGLANPVTHGMWHLTLAFLVCARRQIGYDYDDKRGPTTIWQVAFAQ